MMANPFYVEPVNPLMALMQGQQGYDRGVGISTRRAQEAARQDAAQALRTGGDPRSALAALIGAGDTQGANALANFGNQALDQQYKMGMLDIARQNANRQETPPQLKVLEAAGIDPRSPTGHKALFPRTDTPISPTDKKAIFEAEDSNVPLQSTIETLARAKTLAPKAYSGYSAGIRGAIGANLPDMAVPDWLSNPDTAKATVELNQLLSGEAIKNMAETLKGATTDQEMNRFTTILADPKAPPELKIRTIERMEVLAKRKFELNQARIRDLRGGTYFRPDGGSAPASPAVSPGGAQGGALQQARDAIDRGADRNAVIRRLRENGIDASGL